MHFTQSLGNTVSVQQTVVIWDGLRRKLLLVDGSELLSRRIQVVFISAEQSYKLTI